MKIVLVTPAWPSSAVSNGVATYVDVLYQEFTQTGEEVRILAVNTVGPIMPDVISLKTQQVRKGVGSLLFDRTFGRLSANNQIRTRYADEVIRGVKSLGGSYHPDVIEMEETFGSFELVASRLDMPVVVRLHGPHFLNAAALSMPKDRSYRERVNWEQQAIVNAKAITAPSVDLLDRVRKKYRVKLPQARVIPNPAPSVPKSLQWKRQNADPNLILFVGRFDKHKGGDLVLEAFAKIALEHPKLALAFVGPDKGLRGPGDSITSYSEFVADRIGSSSVLSRIKQLGPLENNEIVKWRLRASMTIVASRYDNFPMTVLEALAHGCPLIAARVGGIKEIVVDEVTGLLVEPDNVDALANCIERLIDSPQLAAELGANGMEDARARFSSRVVAEQTKDYYEQIILNN